MSGKGLYIQLFSIHGLIRGNSPELGRDADTGGQVKYVLELARALGEREDVAGVDLVTRLIVDRTVSEDYSRPIEPLSDKARIVRIQCGGRRYLRKELLWPHIEEFIDQSIRFIKEENLTPDLFHGHYADAGYVAMELAAAFDTPFVFTGHSMGRNKLAKLLADGMTMNQIRKHYKIDTRIQVEEEVIQRADLILTSTQQEIDKQYGLYKERPRKIFQVTPPGIDLETFYPYYDTKLDEELLSEEVKQTRFTLMQELHRFWSHPEKPFILALCRPDHRKNITGLIEAYGKNKELRTVANLAIFAGIRHNIIGMGENEQAVLTDMLLQMDRFDLYGKLAIPKRHDFATEVPELYRLCASGHGVFVNPALVEPFGLTLIEASACGLPIVATADGGPVDIVANCGNGLIVDAARPDEIASALYEVLVDTDTWARYSNNGINGVRRHYSWKHHCEESIKAFHRLLPGAPENERLEQRPAGPPSFGKRLTSLNRLMITDIDNTLVGDDQSMKALFEILSRHQADIAWGMSTGRSLELTSEAMTEYNIPMPDIIICSVGTEIYYGPDLRMDKGWQQHISRYWRPEEIKECLQELEFLVFQEAEGQRSHKISYYLEEKNDRLARVNEALFARKLRCQVIYSHGQFLDIVPWRASKGKAIDYLRYKYKFSTRHVMVAGDSGNDADMLSGKARGLVVGNYAEELAALKGCRTVFFSEHNYAKGIIDGLHHYSFI
ncbi:MAG: HAD-IIB family hydrolase [Thermodesulfobacteriota bacterium]